MVVSRSWFVSHAHVGDDAKPPTSGQETQRRYSEASTATSTSLFAWGHTQSFNNAWSLLAARGYPPSVLPGSSLTLQPLPYPRNFLQDLLVVRLSLVRLSLGWLDFRLLDRRHWCRKRVRDTGQVTKHSSFSPISLSRFQASLFEVWAPIIDRVQLVHWDSEDIVQAGEEGMYDNRHSIPSRSHVHD